MPDSAELRAYRATYAGMDGYYAAASRSRATAMACRVLEDSGWVRDWRTALRGLRVVREPGLDHRAMAPGSIYLSPGDRHDYEAGR